MEVIKRYKQTDVGIIPQGWETKPLKLLSSFITKGATPTTYGYRWEEDGVLFLRSECVSENGLDLSQSMFISLEAHNALIRGEVHSGDILMTITGNVGRVIFLDKEFGIANINQHIAIIRIIDPETDAEYVYHCLSQPSIRKYYNSITTGQAYPQISLVQVRDTEIHLPPFPEQSLIAAALNDVDALIAALDELIAKKRLIKQGAMEELLTGQKRLHGFGCEWKRCVLSNIGTFSKGRGIKKDDVLPDGIPCVRYGEIYTHFDDYIRKFHSYISREIAKQSQSIKNGDLLFTGSGETAEGIGKCVAFLGDEEAYAGGDVVIFTPTNQNSMYLGYLMNQASIIAQKSRMAQGDAIVHISAQKLGQLQLYLPDIGEQTAIAEILSDLDAEIASLEARREKTRLFKQGMMQELLTGRIRLI